MGKTIVNGQDFKDSYFFLDRRMMDSQPDTAESPLRVLAGMLREWKLDLKQHKELTILVCFIYFIFLFY